MPKLLLVGQKLLRLSVDVLSPGGVCLFSRGLYFLFCSLMNSLMRLHKQVYSRVSRIIDVFVFAREGAVKGKGELNKI